MSKLVVQPSSLKSRSHMKMKELQQRARLLRQSGEVGSRGSRDQARGIKTTVTLRDPEREKREKEMAEEKRIRDLEKLKNSQMRRRQRTADQYRSRRLDVNYLEEDDELGDVAVTGTTAREALGLRRTAREDDIMGTDDETEGDEDGEDDDVHGGGAGDLDMKRARDANMREGDDDDDDTVVARPGASKGVKVSGKGKRTLEESSSEDDGEDEEEGDAPGETQDAPSSSKRMRRAIIEDDDDDDDDD